MTDTSLPYDFAFEYARDPLDSQVLPRLRIAVRFSPRQHRPLVIALVLDTGADMSVLDGTLALEAGCDWSDVVDRALATELIYGVTPGRPVRGHVHEIELRFRNRTTLHSYRET